MDYAVEDLCNLLARHKLLDAPTIRSLYQRWKSEAKESADNSDKFARWLVASGHFTDFQMTLLGRGSVEQLFFDEYQLQDRLGRGRMAGVYRAVHPTGQQVAIKVLPPSKAGNPQLLARFQREARIAEPLDHPHVVRTFEHGRTRAGLYYLVMEFLDGESLDEVLKRRKTLTVPETVHIGVQVLEGLQYLFEAGVVHRDVKPSNLMLVPGWIPGQPDTTLSSTVKILDIGLGRALFDENVPATPDGVDLTSEGSILGTPNYMAPEQARSAHGADIRADMYSVGCMLYETLAGKTPFAEPNFMKQILRHATEPPRPLREINPTVPDNVWGVIETLLAKDPAQRYSTPRQAARALKASAPVAIEESGPEQPDEKMQSYLSWLATHEPAPDSPTPVTSPSAAPAGKTPATPASTAPTVAISPPAAAVAGPATPAPAPRAAPKSSPSLPTAQPSSKSSPKLPAAQPTGKSSPKLPAAQTTPKSSPQLPAAQPAPKSSPALPVAQPAAKSSTTLPIAQPVTPPPPTPPRAAPPRRLAPAPEAPPLLQIRGFAVTVRDLICAGIGAGVLVVLEALIWLIAWLLSG